MTAAGCSVPGCERVHYAKQLCALHYARIRRIGSFGLASPEDRFWTKVAPAGSNDCWLWQGSTTPVYGIFFDTVRYLAHRWAYESLIGPIPEGLQIDHLCRTPTCVNPWHMEPVSQRVNIMRSESFTAKAAQKTHCVNGHEFSEANTHVRATASGRERRCRACSAASSLARYRSDPKAANVGRRIRKQKLRAKRKAASLP
ncbi:MAG: HNH endonuclease [Actinomycetota bacterium]|nr:HNH endonuclease [Actinomycetota bacterium]